jgi:N-glycosylase/DNA lyase
VEGDAIRVRSARPLREAQKRAISKVVRGCLQLDLDLGPFWELCRSDPDLRWAAEARAGRFLRAPTAFADAAMVLATTNCSWALTRKIVGSLVREWGRGGAFPEKSRLAGVAAAEFRERAPLGYRAPYLEALARGPDLEALRSDRSPSPELRRRLLDLPGFGPYAAESLLRLLGRFDYLALDSWVVRRWKEMHPRREATPRALERRFARYGEWKGLALWLTVTSRWYGAAEWRDKFEGFPARPSGEGPRRPTPRIPPRRRSPR